MGFNIGYKPSEIYKNVRKDSYSVMSGDRHKWL